MINYLLCWCEQKGTSILIRWAIQVVGNTATRNEWRKVFGVAVLVSRNESKPQWLVAVAGFPCALFTLFSSFFQCLVYAKVDQTGRSQVFWPRGLPSWRHNLVMLHRVHVETGKKHLLDRLIRVLGSGSAFVTSCAFFLWIGTLPTLPIVEVSVWGKVRAYPQKNGLPEIMCLKFDVNHWQCSSSFV